MPFDVNTLISKLSTLRQLLKQTQLEWKWGKFRILLGQKLPTRTQRSLSDNGAELLACGLTVALRPSPAQPIDWLQSHSDWCGKWPPGGQS